MLKGLFGRSGEKLGTVGAARIGPKVFEPWSGEISSFAVHVDASRIGLDITGLGAGLDTIVSSSGFSDPINAFIRFCTELLVLLTEGLVLVGLVVIGTTGKGGADLRTGFSG